MKPDRNAHRGIYFIHPRFTQYNRNVPLKYEEQGNRIEFVLPELHGHQMISVQG